MTKPIEKDSSEPRQSENLDPDSLLQKRFLARLKPGNFKGVKVWLRPYQEKPEPEENPEK